ncbi:hypothetical protein VP01_1079g4 [Puccinia sorghi]|uniref:Uncharacterized protein n=1 Tax=Puccinia sorghi TaxID=27349 RepID=A0A0L6VTF3_9BASI|nr:hypothetical protein VP01_1079g4 [Puccinia sorghi]
MNKAPACLFFVIGFVSLFVEYSNSLTVTEPSSGTVWHLHSPNQVKWQSVSTDPGSLEIRIVNNNPSLVFYSHHSNSREMFLSDDQHVNYRTYPTGYTQTVKDGINTADNKFTVESLPGLKPGRGYQVNIMSASGTILAQSAQFAINGTAEKKTDSTHANTQNIAQPTLAAPSPNTAASASSDANILQLSMREKLVATMVLIISIFTTQQF